MVPLLKKYYNGFRQRLIHSANDHRLAKLALDINQNSPKTDQAPVIFMGVSTRLQGMSLNAGFALLTKWGLHLKGMPVIQFRNNFV